MMLASDVESQPVPSSLPRIDHVSLRVYPADGRTDVSCPDL
jgi:hypothetical protein